MKIEVEQNQVRTLYEHNILKSDENFSHRCGLLLLFFFLCYCCRRHRRPHSNQNSSPFAIATGKAKSFQLKLARRSIVFNCVLTIQFDRFEIDIFYCIRRTFNDRVKRIEAYKLEVCTCTYACRFVYPQSDRLQLHSCAIRKIERSLFACLLFDITTHAHHLFICGNALIEVFANEIYTRTHARTLRLWTSDKRRHLLWCIQRTATHVFMCRILVLPVFMCFLCDL